MRKIKKVVYHIADSDDPTQDNIEAIRYFHTGCKKNKINWGKYRVFCRGWDDVAYHFYSSKAGLIEVGRPMNKQGAHVYGHNKDTLAICLGGTNATEASLAAAIELTVSLLPYLGLTEKDVVGHNELDSGKECPRLIMDEVRKIIKSKLKGDKRNEES